MQESEKFKLVFILHSPASPVSPVYTAGGSRRVRKKLPCMAPPTTGRREDVEEIFSENSEEEDSVSCPWQSPHLSSLQVTQVSTLVAGRQNRIYQRVRMLGCLH